MDYMENQNKKYFFNFFLQNKNLSKVQMKKRDFLIAREYLTPQNTEIEKHVPKDTASFLSLFNDPNGFKFLTHDFDPLSNMNYATLMELTNKVLKEACGRYEIPKSLYALIDTFINGGTDKDGKPKKWRDCSGYWHEENYACKQWKEWSNENPGHHLLSNEEFAKTILKFRGSIRIVKPILSDIVQKQDINHSNLKIETEGLEKADFYTYVWALEDGLKRILDDMNRYSNKTPNLKISFQRKYSDDFSSRIIKITQIGSVSSSLDDALQRFHAGGGAFNEIRKVFTGYCNWSIEAIWDGVPKRWNILKDTEVPEIEEFDETNILGFSHVLTYFSK